MIYGEHSGYPGVYMTGGLQSEEIDTDGKAEGTLGKEPTTSCYRFI